MNIMHLSYLNKKLNCEIYVRHQNLRIISADKIKDIR
jgi:hypothetical protein